MTVEHRAFSVAVYARRGGHALVIMTMNESAATVSYEVLS